MNKATVEVTPRQSGKRERLMAEIRADALKQFRRGQSSYVIQCAGPKRCVSVMMEREWDGDGKRIWYVGKAKEGEIAPGCKTLDFYGKVTDHKTQEQAVDALCKLVERIQYPPTQAEAVPHGG